MPTFPELLDCWDGVSPTVAGCDVSLTLLTRLIFTCLRVFDTIRFSFAISKSGISNETAEMGKNGVVTLIKLGH